MDYQNRVGNKQGGGGLASSQETNAARRARVRELLSSSQNFIENDPYVLRNHLGLLECKLCLTTHISESSFLIHIQGKKHQSNLMRRQHKIEQHSQNKLHQQQQYSLQKQGLFGISNVKKKQYVKIGTPGYQIKKIRHPITEQLGILVVVNFPKIADQVKPLHRFMSYYEQKVEVIGEEDSAAEVNKFQYLIISAEPYENICIKIPNRPIDRTKENNTGLWDYWDADVKRYYLQFFFRGI